MLASAATLLAAARAGRVPMLTRSSFSTLHARYESSTPPPHVGFVGLGQIGARLARRLADRGHALRVLDTDPSAVDAFMSSVPPSQRVARAASLAELSASCGAVITSLPTLSAVRAAWQGEGGLLAGAGPASPLKVGVDISTTGPAYGRELASAASEVGVTMVSAPVSGGVRAAEDGSLTFLVSAACKDATKVATPLLQSMGRRVVVVSTDDPGAAQAAKLANQIALAAQMAGVAEALAYGVGQGLAAERITSVLLASTGRSWSSEVNSPAPGVVATAPASRGYAGGFAVRLMAKDLQAARDSAPPGVPMPMSEATAALFEAASGAGGGDLDFSCIYKLVYGMDGEAEAGKGGERVA